SLAFVTPLKPQHHTIHVFLLFPEPISYCENPTGNDSLMHSNPGIGILKTNVNCIRETVIMQQE
ncbi:MAG: hypothetical protein KAS65_11285, partial [Candidatus Aminicenantes bacterium]|nr:hypothetical protein [Candidatus Aminicenantes bacterium]